ncbi:MAG: polymer-forming cytoskeletal protein [Myxococcales bacterium]|nr:MAG: polymer-forming cytoskeletal protein [Myxococcales bacterium]
MAPSANEINALLGKGSEFEGKLTFEGTVRIDGRFVGEIVSEDTLIVGEGAEVEAEIKVNRVVIYGNVKGNVIAPASVNLHAPARLLGSIATRSLTIAEGVIFEGSCHMTEPPVAQARQARPAAEAARD